MPETDVLDREKLRTPEILDREQKPTLGMLQGIETMATDVRTTGGSLVPIDTEVVTFDAPILLDQATRDKLVKKPTNDELDVKPDKTGAVYVSHTVCRDRLNDAFGPFAWKIVPVSAVLIDRANPQAAVVYREYQLFVAAKIGDAVQWHAGPRAWGEQIYLGDVNQNFTWGDALEGCQSIGLSRCCKAIGMAVDRRTIDKFRQSACVKVFVSKQRDKSISTAWRRLDALPIYGETGVCNDSPNRAKYQPVPAPYWLKDDRQPKPQAAASAPTTTAVAKAGAPARTISRAQGDALWKAVDKQGMADDEVATTIAQRWGFSRTQDITAEAFDAIMQWVKAGGD